MKKNAIDETSSCLSSYVIIFKNDKHDESDIYSNLIVEISLSSIAHLDFVSTPISSSLMVEQKDYGINNVH